MTAVSYAEALYSLAVEENCAEKIYGQLDAVRFAYADNPQLSKILDRPCCDLTERISVIDKCFAGANVHLLNCIKVMCKRRVTSLFVETADEYMRLYRRGHNIENVSVITAHPLSEDVLEKLRLKLEEKLSKHVNITVEIDSSIMGGIRVRTESKQIDSSVKTRLNEIEKQIKSVVLE